MENLPTGTVTFLFTDIEGSTHLWQEQPEAMAVAHARHDEILRTAIEANHGYIFQVVGDLISAAFHNAIDGLRDGVGGTAQVADIRVLKELGGLSRNTHPKPITKVSDLKGLRIFTFPTAGKFLTRFGVVPVSRCRGVTCRSRSRRGNWTASRGPASPRTTRWAGRT